MINILLLAFILELDKFAAAKKLVKLVQYVCLSGKTCALKMEELEEKI